MIHRALFGSIERFFAVLLEHYAGAFPAWLAPVQVLGVPVADEFAPHLQQFIASLEEETVRCEIDMSGRSFRQEDPQRFQVQGSVHPHRWPGRHEQQCGELPLP